MRVKHNGCEALGNVEEGVVLPRKIKPEKATNALHPTLRPDETINLSFEFHNPGRGHYPIGPLTVRVSDVFGLYLTEKRLGHDLLAVMPKAERVRGTDLRTGHLGPCSGIIPSRPSGMGH